MFRQESKRSQLIRRLLSYAVMVIAVVSCVLLIILFILGYRIDSANRLERGALIQLESKPSGARVTIDDDSAASTPTKATLLAGNHTISMNRNGYETWQKTVTLSPGSLLWIDYPILVPLDRPVKSIRTYPSLVDAKASANRRYILLQPSANEPVFRLVNIDADTPSSTDITLPPTAYTAAVTGSFVIDRWDNDGRYVILRHSFDENKLEWIVLDTDQPSRSVNISQLLDIDIAQLRFSGSSGSVFFARLTDGTIRKLDVNAATISRALVTSATDFSVFDSNIITYKATVTVGQTTQSKVGIYKDGETMAVDMLSAQSDDGLAITTTRYVNKAYIAVSSGKTITIYRGDYPRKDTDVTDLNTFATLQFSESVKSLSFSREGTYLLAQAGSRYMSFDMETKASVQASLTLKEPANESLSWIAPGYLSTTADNQLRLQEFDGNNAHGMGSALRGFDVSFSPNQRYLYSIGQTKTGAYSLQRVKMVIN